ncbi:maleylpyruvate isomerase family mycothiol-dependent enzyme [Aeromicrobium sp.]|uniref:maleylpyruvate isomerase family mycothiol-dependent enzyme n=1 Tax=Aeromicrobium sp. TaxID=1871063 RepID=UPI003C451E55
MDRTLELGTAMSRFAELAGLALGEEPIPACAEWTMHGLVAHLGTMHRWAAGTLLSGQRIAAPTPLVTEPLADWYAGTATALLSALQAISPDESIPNFTRNDETAEFWPRRQLHETIVHGVDAAQALGFDESSWAVDPAIAADGIDEVLQAFFPRLTARGMRPDVRSRIRLVATDLQQSWIISPGSEKDGPPVQLHSSLEADVLVSGSASDLYLGLWGRVGPERLQFDGADGQIMFDGPTTP